MEKNEFLKLIGHVLNEKPSEFIKQFSDMMKMKLAESMETEEDGE